MAQDGPEDSFDGRSADYKITTVLLLGSNGQLGSALRRRWSQDEYQQKLCVVASHHEALDIADGDAVEATLEQISPDVVINCAGYNEPCSNQRERDTSWRSNAMGPHFLADGCAKRGILFTHISCDSVFGADSTRTAMVADSNRLAGLGFCIDSIECKYKETDPCGPVDFYGSTKLAGEYAVLRAAATYPNFRYWILRTGSLFEYPWRNGSSYFWDLASLIQSSTRNIPVPSDVQINLCYIPQLVKAVDWMLENRRTYSGGGLLCQSGVYHIANEGVTTWFQVAQQIARSLSGGANLVVPATLDDYRTRYGGTMPPIRELSTYRAMSTDRYKALGGPVMGGCVEAVDDWCVAVGGSSLAVA
jgi:dTDP-4-dehydrorhamnose reductase